MKKIATLAILLFLFVGFAGAVTIGTPVYNNGHSGGDKFPGIVQVNDFIVDDDVQIGDDAAILGDLAVTGSTTYTGAVDFDGNITQAANKGITQAAGTGWLTVGTTGISATSSPLNILENTTWASGKVATAPGGFVGPLTGAVTGNVTAAGTVQAEQLTSTDDARVAGTTTTDSLVVNTTTTQNGPLTLDDALVRSPYDPSMDTVTTDGNAPGLWFVGNASANQTITLPTAANSSGYTMTFVVDIDPGSYNVVIEGAGAETINGNASKTNSDQYSVLELTCNGTAWYITDSIGTWS